MTRRRQHRDRSDETGDFGGGAGEIRATMASVHGQMIEHIATLGLAVHKRLTAPPRRDIATAHNYGRQRSSDLPEYAVRLSAAAMHDVALVAQLLATGADDAQELHGETPPPPAPQGGRALRHGPARAHIERPRGAQAFDQRMQDISAAMDRGMAAPAAEPDRPDFIAFERAVLARLKEAGLELELEALNDDRPPPAPPEDDTALLPGEDEGEEAGDEHPGGDSGGDAGPFPGRRFQG